MQCTAEKKDGTLLGITKAENKTAVIDDLRCQAVKADGHRCGGNRIKGSKFCYMHDPDPATEKKRKRAREAGGRHSHRAKYMAVLADKDPDIQLWTLEDARNLQEKAANLFLRDKIDINTSREMRQTAETFIRTFEACKAAGVDLDKDDREAPQTNKDNRTVDILVRSMRNGGVILFEEILDIMIGNEGCKMKDSLTQQAAQIEPSPPIKLTKEEEEQRDAVILKLKEGRRQLINNS